MALFLLGPGSYHRGQHGHHMERWSKMIEAVLWDIMCKLIGCKVMILCSFSCWKQSDVLMVICYPESWASTIDPGTCFGTLTIRRWHCIIMRTGVTGNPVINATWINRNDGVCCLKNCLPENWKVAISHYISDIMTLKTSRWWHNVKGIWFIQRCFLVFCLLVDSKYQIYTTKSDTFDVQH